MVRPLLLAAGLQDSAEFQLSAAAAGHSALSSKLANSNAAVYLSNIGAVSDVAKTIREHEAKLGVDRYVENIYKRMHVTNQLSTLIFGVIGICAFFLSTVNIFLMFYQTILRKRHEIGILKAFGCSRNRIAWIFFVESFYIALSACIIGLFLALYFGNWTGNTLKNIYELSIQGNELFHLHWGIVGIILFSVFGLCQLITYFATSNTAQKTSNELLRQRE